MIYRMPYPDEWLTEGVRTRRIFAWFVDLLLIGLIAAGLWFVPCCSACSLLVLASR